MLILVTQIHPLKFSLFALMIMYFELWTMTVLLWFIRRKNAIWTIYSNDKMSKRSPKLIWTNFPMIRWVYFCIIFHISQGNIRCDQHKISPLSQTHCETVLSAAWPRYITLSGYGIETRHLIKEYRREEWKGRSTIRLVETQTEKTSRMQKKGESQWGRGTRSMHRNGRMFEPSSKKKKKEERRKMRRGDAIEDWRRVLLLGKSRCRALLSLISFLTMHYVYKYCI